MSVLNKLIEIASPLCSAVYYDEAKAMNVSADGIKAVEVINDMLIVNDSFIYIEEFTQGRYTVKPFFNKTTKMNVYFSAIINETMESAEFRQRVRECLETKIVIPFTINYNKSNYFFPVTEWEFQTALPHFDAHEVSIMLAFDCKERNMC